MSGSERNEEMSTGEVEKKRGDRNRWGIDPQWAAAALGITTRIKKNMHF